MNLRRMHEKEPKEMHRFLSIAMVAVWLLSACSAAPPTLPADEPAAAGDDNRVVVYKSPT
jgi:uncharacterized lipoprotein YajG